MCSTVLNGSVIGQGSIVGAGALVKEGTIVPPYSLVVGVPAKGTQLDIMFFAVVVGVCSGCCCHEPKIIYIFV